MDGRASVVVGRRRASEPWLRSENQHRWRDSAWLRKMGIVDRGRESATTYVVVRGGVPVSADLTERGSAIGPHDLLIAATAMTLEFTVATCDLRSFPRID